MSMVIADGLAKAYDADYIFQNVSFEIPPRQRIALVGPNGEGKSTLLRIIAGELVATTGKLQRRRDLRTGYLPQDPPPAPEGVTLRQTLLDVFAELHEIERQLHDLAADLADRPGDQNLLTRYGQAQTLFETRGGYDTEQRTDRVLGGLGFRPEQYDMPLEHLSGGQRSRAMLGRLLLETPDLLLLDEPTNHLDLQAVEWLERYLQDFPGAIVVVSHDRWFLDRVSAATWEVAEGRMETYKGSYSQYVRQRAERLVDRLRVWQAQQEYIAKTEDFIRRHLAGQRTKEAQGRRSRLERFLQTEAIPRPRDFDQIHIRLRPQRRSSEIVLRAEGLEVGYVAGQPLVKLPDVEVPRGRRIAIVGPNGVGKTTLLRTLLGQIEPLGGSFRIGANADVGYLSQTHETLSEGRTVLDAVLDADLRTTPESARTLLGSLGLSGDDAFRKVQELSGGQRSRVILAQLAVQGSNVLLLDEPTNHLDLPSREILQQALREFEGTVVMVSHDRYLVQSVATDIWAIEDGRLHRIYGGWEDYIQWRSLHQAGQASTSTQEQRQRAQKRRSGQQAHQQRKELARLQRRQEKLEDEIAQVEADLARLTDEISVAGQAGDMDSIHSLGDEYQRQEQRLGELYEEWSDIAEQSQTLDTEPA